jgi:hypothetical protein
MKETESTWAAFARDTDENGQQSRFSENLPGTLTREK